MSEVLAQLEKKGGGDDSNYDVYMGITSPKVFQLKQKSGTSYDSIVSSSTRIYSMVIHPKGNATIAITGRGSSWTGFVTYSNNGVEYNETLTANKTYNVNSNYEYFYFVGKETSLVYNA